MTIVDSFAHESGHIEHFPAMNYGLNNDGTEPRFTSKKEAKRFAAKCAVEWLVAQGLMPSFLPLLAAASPPVTLKRTMESTPSTTPPPPKRQNGTNTPAGGGPDGASLLAASTNLPSPRVTELVETKCRELNIAFPKYSFTELESNTYNAKAAIDNYGDAELLALERWSMVEGVVGKDAAKNAVAAKLLEKLREIEAERDEQLQIVMANLNHKM